MNEQRHPQDLWSYPAASPGGRTQPTAPTRVDEDIDLLAALHTIWRGRWLILLAAIVAVGLGGIYAFRLATPFYTASATVVLESREEQIVDIDSVMTGLSGDQATINTEVEVLKARGLAEKLVDRMNLLEDPEFNTTLQPEPMISVGKVVGWLSGQQREAPEPRAIYDATVDRVVEATTVSNLRESYVFRIQMVTQSAEKSARMANALAEVYINDQLEVKYAATDAATEWLRTRVTELREDLEAAESAVKDFNATTELISAEALEGLNRQLKDLRERLQEANGSYALAETRLATLAAAESVRDPVIAAETIGDATLIRLAVAEGASGAFDARLAALESRAEMERDRAAEQITALESSRDRLEERIGSQSEDLVKLQQLQREAEASGTIYAYFLSRLKETSVQRGIQQADSRVLSAAIVPRKPSQPRKAIVLALAGMLGVFAGMALVLMREASRNTFRTPEDLAAFTQHSVMGTIPKIPVRKRGRMIDYVLAKPTSSAVEAVRNLRTSLMLSNVDQPPRVILSTSSVPSEGKTTQSILLAQNFAALGRRVLLVEGDMRRRVFEQYFDIKSQSGFRSLGSILTEDVPLSDAVAHDATLKIDVLVSDKTSVNAADLYASEKFRNLVQEMRQEYDIVIIDTPPVLVVPDARVIAPQVDAVLYTVRWDYTHRSQVREGLRMLESIGVRASGLVLSQVDPRGLKRYGYNQYGGYGGSYRGYYEN